MIDLRREAVVVADKATGKFEDKTKDVLEYQHHGDDGRISIRFRSGNQTYSYGPDRARILRGRPMPVPPGSRVSVDGEIWPHLTEVWAFDGPEGPLRRVFSRGDKCWTWRAEQVQLIAGAQGDQPAAAVLQYWRTIVSRLIEEDPLRRPFATLDFIHPDSALAGYLAGAPVLPLEPQALPIFPFRCNLSQREAVEKALTQSISVIEGPPGTGKTETILNLIANIVTAGGTVGVVSLSNSAVENVHEKLTDLGFGFITAGLGSLAKRQGFFRSQSTRTAEVERLLTTDHKVSVSNRFTKVDTQLRAAQADERQRAELRLQIDAHVLERRHFEDHLFRQEVPELQWLPLLRRSSGRILDFIAETQLELTGSRPGLFQRIRKYFLYGSLHGLDPSETDVVLRLQEAYYERRINELRTELAAVDDRLRKASFDSLSAEHQELSAQCLRTALAKRYRKLSRTIYTEESYRTGTTFRRFTKDYPVVLSTCHSLRRSLAEGTLLDYVIIDEASQVDLLTAALALSCCRNLVVVGDQRQLAQIDSGAADGLVSPASAYDYRQHSILTSLKDLYGDEQGGAAGGRTGLKTVLREHYRCDPAIIGFCNKAFYDGHLIPYTTTGSDRPMAVVRTVAGNHMRQHRGGGRSNQREVDVIITEVIPEHCADVPPADIGITTPYNRQVDKVVAALVDACEANTVHKFQGRQKPVVILTTVLDETWRGRIGHRFVDDPRMINVAVSRAAKRFILVTNNDLMPTSRYIRDLIGYIRYHDPDQEVMDSAVISIFDLLYQRYDKRLRPLAARRRKKLKYDSEDIAWTVLTDLLDEEKYDHLTVACQVLLRNLLPDLNGLTPRQADFVRHLASVDFVVYNRVTNQPWLAVEVDGFSSHENNPRQLERDALKDEILLARQLPLLRLPTTGSREERRIREALDQAELHWSVPPEARQ